MQMDIYDVYSLISAKCLKTEYEMYLKRFSTKARLIAALFLRVVM